jgi:hypothetical protein
MPATDMPSLFRLFASHGAWLLAVWLMLGILYGAIESVPLRTILANSWPYIAVAYAGMCLIDVFLYWLRNYSRGQV